MVGFCALCSAATAATDHIVITTLSWKYLRWFGNISYSYYLVHAFVVVSFVRIVLNLFGRRAADWSFWATFLPIFMMTFVAGASLFLWIEKPLSLRRHFAAERAGAPQSTRA
jgi:peptidoglycan/LPS O-acetylase OafA/YrhL